VVRTILGRRSIRWGFESRPVEDAVIREIVSCALAAPSSKNAQPWRIHVVRDPAVLSELADAVDGAKNAETYVPIDPATGEPRQDWTSTVAESAEVLRSVSVGLFVENRGKFSDGRATVANAANPVRENALVGYGFEMVGIGAAIQSMWLAAAELGLAGVFMGDVLIAEDVICDRLGMRGDLVGVLALGYSAGEPAPKALGDDRAVWH
jgi:nitroreductase